MKTIQPYIDLGFHTVPMNGTLERLPNGKKTKPHFPNNWATVYSSKINTNATELGAVIPGKVSNIVAIDCDTEETFQLFKNLDPDYRFVFRSKGKPEGGGTFIYKYTDELPKSFRHVDEDQSIFLEFFSESHNRCVFLATEANHTKEPLPEDLQTADALRAELREMPFAAFSMLRGFSLQSQETKSQNSSSQANKGEPIDNTQRTYFGPPLVQLVEPFVATGVLSKQLAKATTPKSFRHYKAYHQKGYLLPTDIPDGEGSNYLSKVSAILGADPSIDEKLYVKAMLSFNSQWQTPWPHARLQTLIDQMLKGSSRQFWRYDADYAKGSITFTDVTTKELKEIVMVNTAFCVINHFTYSITYFDSIGKLFGYIRARAVGGDEIVKSISSIKAITVINSLAVPPGFAEDGVTFNGAVRSFAMEVIANPTLHKGVYPVATMRLLNNLFKDEATRDYILQFVKRKLTHFEYSPIIFYMLGAQGTGKDSLIRILERLTRPTSSASGEQPVMPVQTITSKNLVADFNQFLDGSAFVYIPEMAKTPKLLGNAMDTLKQYSGSPSYSLRRMRSDTLPSIHYATFILAANKNTLPFDLDDRRVLFLPSTERVDTQPWVAEEYGDAAAFFEQIEAEMLDFAWYLGTLPLLDKGAMFKVPTNNSVEMKEVRQEVIESSLHIEQQVTQWIVRNDVEQLALALVDTEMREELVVLADGTKQRDYLPRQVIQKLCNELAQSRYDSNITIPNKDINKALRLANIMFTQQSFGRNTTVSGRSGLPMCCTVEGLSKACHAALGEHTEGFTVQEADDDE